MNIENALKISGWMRPEELTWLATQAEKHYNIAEIGSWMGRSTRAIADSTPGCVYAVDTWAGPDTEEINRQLKGKPASWLKDEFLNNIGEELLAQPLYRVRPVQMTSLQAAERFAWPFICPRPQGASAHMSFDMIFIDAAHDYASVKEDILAWRPLLAKGGLLCGHDYTDWPTVKQAVDELVPGARAVAGSIWAAPVAE